MSADQGPFKTRYKFELQTAVFILMVIPSLGLYWAVLGGCSWAVWALLAAVLFGVLLGLWAS